jgi:hypothetical protein
MAREYRTRGGLVNNVCVGMNDETRGFIDSIIKHIRETGGRVPSVSLLIHKALEKWSKEIKQMKGE